MAGYGGGAQGMTRITFDRPLPVKLACQSCRSGHQKCDGALPICLRCKKEQKTCDYTPSRRGRSVAHLHKRRAESSRVFGYSSTMLASGFPSNPSVESDVATSILSSHDPLNSLLARSGAKESLDLVPTPISMTSSLPFSPDHLLNFHSHFWPAHPFLPPMMYIDTHMNGTAGDGLRSIVNYIGCKYSGERLECHAVLEAPQNCFEYSQCGVSVQILILLAISQHMMNDREKAQLALDAAVKIALTIGLDKEYFASDHGDGVPAIEESWRRTWWELYILDVMFAALNQNSIFRLKDVQLEVHLPCEEAAYRADNLLSGSRSLQEFDARFFLDHEIKYSSFSYRIAAARAVSNVVNATNNQGPLMSTARKEAELELENLKLHLPKHVEDFVDSAGAVDEMAFQTHMMINAGIVYLHRPQSLLAPLSPKHTITCAPTTSPIYAQTIQHHTRKTIDAANQICHLISCTDLLTHTPFFICAVAMQAVVHLSIYHLPDWNASQKLTEEQIKMSIGALAKLSEVWDIAKTVKYDVKSVARALLDVKHSCSTTAIQMADQGQTSNVANSEQHFEVANFSDIGGLPQVNDESWIDQFLAGLPPA